MRSRDAAFQKYHCVKTAALWISYKQIRNKCTAAVKTAKKNFFISCARSDPRAFWHQVKSCSDTAKSKLSLLPWPCSTATINKISAGAVNEHFISSVKMLNLQHASSATTSATSSSCALHDEGMASTEAGFQSKPLSVKEVDSALNVAQITGAVGSDDITGRNLKISCKGISSVNNIFLINA